MASDRGVALVTGASSGIGAATALRLARVGFPVALLARRGDRLAQMCARIQAAGGRAYAVPADLRRPEERERAVAQAQAAAGPIEVLVNNAGIGWYGYFADMPTTEVTDIVSVNVTAPAHLASLLVPGMVRRGRGAVITVGSISANFAAPGNVVYGATKSFVGAFTAGLHRELSRTGVQVGVVHAGPVRSEFFAAGAERSGRRAPGERLGVPPERVADAVLALLRRPRRQVYVPWWMRATAGTELWGGWLLDRVPPRLLG